MFFRYESRKSIVKATPFFLFFLVYKWIAKNVNSRFHYPISLINFNDKIYTYTWSRNKLNSANGGKFNFLNNLCFFFLSNATSNVEVYLFPSIRFGRNRVRKREVNFINYGDPRRQRRWSLETLSSISGEKTR